MSECTYSISYITLIVNVKIGKQVNDSLEIVRTRFDNIQTVDNLYNKQYGL